MKNKTQESFMEANHQVRPVILVFVSFYLPGYKSGGPVRSIVNLVNQLSDQFDFRIVTSDRDWMEKEPYKEVVVDSWNQVGKAQVYYLSPKNHSLLFIAKLLSVTHYDVLYLNSFFDRVFTQKPLWARKLGLSPIKPLIIATRGEFSSGAFALKYWKKKPYTWLSQKIGLFKEIIWHASTEYEASNIRHCLAGNKVLQILIASDIPSNIPLDNPLNIPSGDEPIHGLRIVFLSRITPKKNLDFALRVLSKVQVPVHFDIYGPIGENDYWHKCKVLMKNLPPNITARYAGTLAHSDVSKVFRSYDLFFFPTHGENYGHVIMESLSAGTPLLIANTTPWLNLEQAGVGWALSLDSEKVFIDKIHIAAQFSDQDRIEWRKRVILYAIEKSTDAELLLANRRLFWSALQNTFPTV
jgi:glycosyltransferase involved in cell wall biosynthesis